MTDQHEPDDRDLPTAGRQPSPASEPGSGDEVTARLDGPSLALPPGRDDEIDPDGPTRPLRMPRTDPEGPTRSLRMPGADLEGPTRSLPAPRADPAWDDPELRAEPEPPPSPEAVTTDDPSRPAEPAAVPAEEPEPAEAPKAAPRRRITSAGALIWVLVALFGFTLVVQLRSNDGDQGLATARQEDLVRILSDLEARDSRLQSEISALETSQRQLTSGVAGRQAALAEADKRADELGLLAGTLPGRGPGLQIALDRVKASAVLNAVQELRGAGGEVMQVSGSGGNAVRIVASSYFVDAEGGGIIADGARLSGPFTLLVIGSPQTMQTALQIPGGVVASVNSGGGSVTMEARSLVEVTAVRQATALQYARPVS